MSFANIATFTADGVLFDMDGTLTDSIAAVEAAWTLKAQELGLEPTVVIAATHGRRASDNLLELVPGMKKEHVDGEVDRFERTILAFADTPPQSRKSSFSSEARTASSRRTSSSGALGSSLAFTQVTKPHDNLGWSPMQNSPDLSLAFNNYELRKNDAAIPDESPFEDEFDDEKAVDMSVRILPGVRALIDSLPTGMYAVATSGAKTYCHGCLARTGIKIPDVCVTADDSRLLRGKPFPDPFLLAAADLGIDPTRAVIFEDSPSGIKAAVAAGSTVIAVCTSHRREQIENLGAHFVIDTMDQVKVVQGEDGKLVFTIAH